MSSEKQLKYWLSLKGKPRTKRGSIQPCFICKEDFYVYPYQKEVSKFCSRKCQLVDRKGKPRAGNPANWKHTEVVKLKMSETRLKNPQRYWLGKKMPETMKAKMRKKHRPLTDLEKQQRSEQSLRLGLRPPMQIEENQMA